MLTATVSQRTMTLVGELQVHHLHELKADLNQALEESDLAVVDVSGVNDVDVAGLQLLLAFFQSAGHRSSPCKLTGIGPGLRKALQLTGLEQPFAAFTE
jgi:anti-anti-sigma factor